MQSYPKCYAYCVLNISDFRHVDLSAAYVSKVLDLFSRYNLGLDLYFTEPVLKAFSEKHPELIEKIRRCPLATINFHVRRPHPCDEDMLRLPDPQGRCQPLESLDYGYVVNKINDFESHELVVNDYDFRSPTYCPHYNSNRIGGFDYLKEVFRTTPIFSGANMEGAARRALMTVLKNKGLKGIVIHHRGRSSDPNTPFRKYFGLLERPADFSCVFPEIVRARDPYSVFLSRMNSFSNYARPVFGNLLVHDYDFYHRGVWFDDVLPSRRFGDWQKSREEQERFWWAYENLVQSLINNREIKIINAKDLITMSEQFFSGRP